MLQDLDLIVIAFRVLLGVVRRLDQICGEVVVELLAVYVHFLFPGIRGRKRRFIVLVQGERLKPFAKLFDVFLGFFALVVLAFRSLALVFSEVACTELCNFFFAVLALSLAEARQLQKVLFRIMSFRLTLLFLQFVLLRQYFCALAFLFLFLQ